MVSASFYISINLKVGSMKSTVQSLLDTLISLPLHLPSPTTNTFCFSLINTLEEVERMAAPSSRNKKAADAWQVFARHIVAGELLKRSERLTEVRIVDIANWADSATATMIVFEEYLVELRILWLIKRAEISIAAEEEKNGKLEQQSPWNCELIKRAGVSNRGAMEGGTTIVTNWLPADLKLHDLLCSKIQSWEKRKMRTRLWKSREAYIC